MLNFVFIFLGLLFLGMLLSVVVGIWYGTRRLEKNISKISFGIGPIQSAVFALFGLLVTFTFLSAAERFDLRRHLIIDEVNLIGTSWLRIELLPEANQPKMQDLFRRYLDSRLLTYQKVVTHSIAIAEDEKSRLIRDEIWKLAVRACLKKGDPAVTSLVLASLNGMFDKAQERMYVSMIHPPLAIFFLLFIAGLICSFFIGFDMSESKSRSWIYILGFVFIITLAQYIILDLEFPRVGLIRVDNMDSSMVDLRSSMNNVYSKN